MNRKYSKEFAPMKFKEFIEEIKNQEGMAFLDGASQNQIDLFEKENNIVLPSAYKEWLLFSDGGEFYLPGGAQMYGVAHQPLINCNDIHRPNDNYIVIGSLASGDPILFRKGSEEISIYNIEEDRIEEDEKYDDFISFLNDIQNMLDTED